MMVLFNDYMTIFIKNLGFDAIDCSINDVALSIALSGGVSTTSGGQIPFM